MATSAHQFSDVLFNSQMDVGSKSEVPRITPERRRDLHAAAVYCIVRDGLPFDLFRQPGMAQFLETAIPGYIGPDRKTVRRKVAAFIFIVHHQASCCFI